MEDGEIDPERSRSFTACTRRIYREKKRQREKERRSVKDEKVEENLEDYVEDNKNVVTVE